MELKFHNDVMEFSELKNTEITVAVDDEGLYSTSRIKQRRIIESGSQLNEMEG